MFLLFAIPLWLGLLIWGLQFIAVGATSSKKQKRCAKCGAGLPLGSSFCGACGAAVYSCTRCYAIVRADLRVCACGNRLLSPLGPRFIVAKRCGAVVSAVAEF